MQILTQRPGVGSESRNFHRFPGHGDIADPQPTRLLPALWNPFSHDALSSSHMLGVAPSQVKKTRYLPSGYMTWKCASIKVHTRTCQMLNWFEKQIKCLFTLYNKPFGWTFVSRWDEGRVPGIGCGDQISGNEMKGRLQDWVVNQHHTEYSRLTLRRHQN